jgi:hypothetical protein
MCLSIFNHYIWTNERITLILNTVAKLISIYYALTSYTKKLKLMESVAFIDQHSLSRAALVGRKCGIEIGCTRTWNLWLLYHIKLLFTKQLTQKFKLMEKIEQFTYISTNMYMYLALHGNTSWWHDKLAGQTLFDQDCVQYWDTGWTPYERGPNLQTHSKLLLPPT